MTDTQTKTRTDAKIPPLKTPPRIDVRDSIKNLAGSDTFAPKLRVNKDSSNLSSRKNYLRKMAAFWAREFADASLRSTMIGDYSAIGFGRSMTEAFDELRTEQDRIVKCLKATVRTYRKLKTRGEEEEEEEDEFKDLSESIATTRYCEDRERLMDSLRQWTFDSAFQIGENFVDAEKDAERIQRILDFVNSAKTMLRATTPLGRQTEER